MRVLLFQTLVVLCLISLTAFAQVVTRGGEIYGRVMGEENERLADVLIALDSAEIPTQTTKTTAGGNFRFVDLPPGFYNLNFVRSGYREIRQESIRVVTGGHVEVAINLKRSFGEKILVSAEQNLLDRKKTTTSLVFTQEYLERVPNGRDPWFLLGMTPGVDSSRLDTGTGSLIQPTFFGRGDSFSNNSWHYDGVDHTEPANPGTAPTYYDFEAFEEIEISTGGNDVSLQTGGIGINLVTKRGGNTWEGDVAAFRSKETSDYGFHVGGPLIKNKLFIWGGYRFVNDETQEQFSIRASSKLDDINTKINFNWNDAHSSQIGYLRGNKTAEDRDIYGNSAPEALVDQRSRGSGIWSFEHTWLINDRSLFTLRYGLLDLGFALIANGGTDKPIIFLQPIFRVENTAFTADPIERTAHNINLDGNYYKEAFLGADHEFRFGFEYKIANIHTFSTYGNGINISDFYQTIPGGHLTAGYLSLQHPINLKMERQGRSIYFSDTIRKERFTLNIGMRYDYQTGKNKPSTIQGVNGFEEFVGGFTYEGGDPGIGTHDFSPRLGFTYSLTKDNKTILKGNYARYYDAFNPQFITHSNPTAVYNGAIFFYENRNGDRTISADELIGDPIYYGGNNAGTFDMDAFAASRIYDSNLSNAWTSEWILGFEREITKDFFAGAALTNRRYGNFLRILPYGVSTEDYIPGGIFEASTPIGDFSVPYFVLGNQHDGTAILTNIKDYEQSYRGLDLYLQKRMSNNFLLNAFLTLQRQEGHYNGGDSLAIQTERNRGVAVTYPFDPTNLPFLDDQPYSYAGSNGSLNPFSDWSVEFSGIYLFPSDISIGAYLRYQQGYSMVLFANVPDDSLSAFYGVLGHSILVESIGSRRYDNVFTIDFQIQKSFDFGSKGRFTGILTIFNLTNAQTVTSRARFLNFGNFNEVIATLDERSYRFGLRYSF